MAEKVNRVGKLESQIKLLKKENEELKKHLDKNLLTIPFFLLSEIEEIDFLIFDNTTNKFHFLANKSIVLPKLPENIDDVRSIIHGDDLPVFDSMFEKIKEKPYTKNQLRIIIEKEGAKDNKPVEIILLNNPVNDKLLFIAIKDISQITKQRKELQKTREKIEESDKLKNTILSNISHHIRTPLNSITGFAELLAGGDVDTLKRREYIEIIKRQGKRILNLIDDVSEIAKLDAGRIIISKIPSNLKLVLNEILLGINHQRTKKQQEQVEIRLNIPEGKGLELMTDSGRLQQCIINIINYSLRNTQKGQIEFGYRFDKPLLKIIFFINDTSNGLSKDEQKFIFNKFSVIENTESSKLEDPGLGLTIARSIIKSLGGKIWIESEEGKGNSFMFTVPFEPVPKTEHVDIEGEITYNLLFQWPNKRILIVDDEEVNAMFLDAVFQGTGVQVLFAKNGLEAVELCKNISGIDLILMDLKMPVMNGLKATQEIRKFNKKIPIIAQTALASEEYSHKCSLAGCNDVIIKPIEVQELMVLVSKFFLY